MATVYNQIKDGKLRESDVLSQDVADLNTEFDIASESAELHDGTVTMTVGDVLYKMITVSDNYAALLLTEKVTLREIVSFLNGNEFAESKLSGIDAEPTTTASDVALFFKKLYTGELTDREYTNKMLTLLKEQRLNGKLPKYLPDDLIVAHKTGELDDVTHDAGIVYSSKGDYIIVVLAEADDRDLREERIANISKNVYNYFAAETD